MSAPFSYTTTRETIEIFKLVCILVSMVVKEIGAFEAKTHFSELLSKTAKGESFIITKRGQPIAKLIPAFIKRSQLFPGCAPNVVAHVAEDFDAPLDDMRPYME